MQSTTLLPLLGSIALVSPMAALSQPITLQETVVGLAQEMAQNASRLDARSNSRFIQDTTNVVYVSKGVPVTGKNYVRSLGEFYSKQKSISWTWDKWEVTPIGLDAAVFTGLATIKGEPKEGKSWTEHAIFTQVFQKTPSGWKRIIAHKSLLESKLLRGDMVGSKPKR